MFENAISFNQDIGSWDVSNGTDFSDMFKNAESFNQDIGSWDVSNGTDFYAMFNQADVFNQDIGNWNVSNGIDFRIMLEDAIAFNQDIRQWNISSSAELDNMLNNSGMIDAPATPTSRNENDAGYFIREIASSPTTLTDLEALQYVASNPDLIKAFGNNIKKLKVIIEIRKSRRSPTR